MAGRDSERQARDRMPFSAACGSGNLNRMTYNRSLRQIGPDGQLLRKCFSLYNKSGPHLMVPHGIFPITEVHALGVSEKWDWSTWPFLAFLFSCFLPKDILSPEESAQGLSLLVSLTEELEAVKSEGRGTWTQNHTASWGAAQTRIRLHSLRSLLASPLFSTDSSPSAPPELDSLMEGGRGERRYTVVFRL